MSDHAQKFIEEIKKRPSIYDPSFNDSNAKIIAWQEVCQAMTPNWDRRPRRRSGN